MAVVMVLVFTGVLMALGGALITYSSNEMLIARYQAMDVEKYYIAEAGLEAGIAALQADFNYQGTINGSIARGSFEVKFEDITAARRRITATGMLDDYITVLSVTVEKEPDQDLKVVEWLKP